VPDRPDPLENELVARIRRRGPLPFDEVMDLALYDPTHGFYVTGGGAGRRGDFITSPEVGPLFGAVLARALDGWWRDLGEPDPFIVVEAAAGTGTLALSVIAAAPACLPALTYVLVERSAALRSRQADRLPVGEPALALPPVGDDPGAEVAAEAGGRRVGSGPRVVSLADLPAIRLTGVVLANELLDNVAFRLLERHVDGWFEVRVTLAPSGALVEQLVPAPDDLAAFADRLAPDAPTGGRIPVQLDAGRWLRRALDLVERGRVVLIDYGADTAALACRPGHDWLRTYHGHEPGRAPLEQLGGQDITAEVAFDQLARVARPTRVRDQATFLAAHGLEELVAEGRRTWHERAHLGDLEAVRGRSRIREAEALVDPAGLGAFLVAEWDVPG